jgi:Flp pilus assembly protein TadG
MVVSSSSSKREQDGAVAAEFAFLAPLLVLLLVGIVQFGLAMYRVSMVESATREGARVAAVGGSSDDVRDRVETSATGFDPAELAITSSGCASVGDDVTVTVEATGARLRISIPFWGEQDPSYRAIATFRCERTGGPP